MVASIRLLGNVVAWNEGQEVGLGSPKQRAVLCALAMRANETVDRETLIDAIWGDSPPINAVSSLYSYISGLRQVLEPNHAQRASRILPASRGGYLLDLARERIDALRFSDLCGRARRLSEAGDHAHALSAIEQSLALWQGTALAGVAGPFAEIERARLGELRLTATEDRLELLLHLGRHHDGVADLCGLVREFPLRERLRCLLMLALYRGGRQAEALDVFSDARRTLIEELGIEPGYELRRCHQEVLAGSLQPGATAAADGVPASPVSLCEVSFCESPVRQLPSATPDFTGRLAERAKIIELLDQARTGSGVPIIVIAGAPGTGKTELALNVAHELRDRYPGGQFYAELRGPAGSRRPEDVLYSWLRSMGVPENMISAGLFERAALFRSWLALRRGTLIVLDDVTSMAQLRPLLPGTVGDAVIVTAGTRLMTLAGSRTLMLDVLPPSDAITMIEKITGEQAATGDRTATTELAHACGYLPLALRIAGARLVDRPDLSLSAFAKALAAAETRLDLLEAGDLSVRGSLAKSYDALGPAQQHAFRLLGLLQRDDFASWVIAALLGKRHVDDVIDALVNMCILIPLGIDEEGYRRYSLHSLLRDYARERLKDAPAEDLEHATDRMLATWVDHARRTQSWARRLPDRLRTDPTMVSGR
ncbi:BTAD domain-containing putative transcriptional regulator [Nonomuraea sp. NPDC049158]|uniref:AfsR/SARP family transcriptional regulator n=1 Tax=Nonomuraea sp. NPDC049158 TaxID=3155649 RepID=UPI0033FDAD89